MSAQIQNFMVILKNVIYADKNYIYVLFLYPAAYFSWFRNREAQILQLVCSQVMGNAATSASKFHSLRIAENHHVLGG